MYGKIISSGNGNIEDSFFLGLSYLYIDQSPEAIAHLRQAFKLPPSSDFRSKEIVRWYLSLAYIKHGELKNAKQELEAIVEGEGTKKKPAVEMLKILVD